MKRQINVRGISAVMIAVLICGIVPLLMPSSVFASAPTSSYTVLMQLWQDGLCANTWWAGGNGANTSATDTPSPSCLPVGTVGTKVSRQKWAPWPTPYPSPYPPTYVNLVSNPLSSLGDIKDSAAVQFWFNPMASINGHTIEIGASCENSGKHPSVRVSAVDYLGLTAADYGEYKWKLVKIPLRYLADHGTYYDGNNVVATSDVFYYNRIDGISISCSCEGFTSSGANLYRLTDVKIVSYIAPPTNLQAVSGDTTATITWTASTGAPTGYYVYRDDVLIATLPPTQTTYTDTGLTNGTTYTYKVQSYDANSTSDPVAVQSVPGGGNASPIVNITAPANNATIMAGTNLTISANAFDTDGTIDKVEFYQNDTLLGESTTSPYTFTWNNVPAGSYSLTAKAYDNLGATASSTVNINVIVNQPPTVSITYPANNETFAAGASIPFMLNVSDADGSVSKVEYFRNGTKIGESTAFPFIYTWANIPAGSYAVTAVATDNMGAQTTSPVVNINVGSGTTVRQLYKDGFINSWTSGTSFAHVEKSTDITPAEGSYELKIKSLADKSFVNFRILCGVLSNQPALKDTAALQFWVYANADPKSFAANYQVTLLSDYSGVVECRLPMSKYITSQDYKKWTLVTIPFTEFVNYGTYFKGSSMNDPATASEFNWNRLEGAGFVSSTTGLPDTPCYVDDVKYVIFSPSPLQAEYISYMDGADNTITSLAQASDIVKGNINIINNSGEIKHVTAVMALYKDNKLVGVKSVGQDVQFGRTMLQNPGFDLSNFGQGTFSIKTFIWDYINSIKPYGTPYQLN